MEKLKKMINQFIIFILLFTSCSNFNNTSKKDAYDLVVQKTLINKVEDVAKAFIRELREEIDRPVYINVLLKKNQQYHEFEIYLFDILLKDDELPFSFSTYSYKGINIIYYYQEGAKKGENKDILEPLVKQNLIKDNNIVLENENTLRLNDFISWNLFICKKNVDKIKVIKSHYVLDEDEKPKKVCND
jgi:hypothetical protein